MPLTYQQTGQQIMLNNHQQIQQPIQVNHQTGNSIQQLQQVIPNHQLQTSNPNQSIQTPKTN